MKKLIFMLLLSVAAFGQTTNTEANKATQNSQFKGGVDVGKKLNLPPSSATEVVENGDFRYDVTTGRVQRYFSGSWISLADYADLTNLVSMGTLEDAIEQTEQYAFDLDTLRVPYNNPTDDLDLGAAHGLNAAYVAAGYGGLSDYAAPAYLAVKHPAVSTGGSTTVFGTFNSIGQRQVFVFADDQDVHYIGNRGAGNQASNTVFGAFAFGKNTTGGTSSFFGYQAGFSNTTGSGNTAVGYQALYASTTGNVNSAFGQFAGSDLTIGSFNNFSGRYAGRGFLDGSRNIFLTTGQDEASGITEGNGNVIIGRPTGLPASTSNMVYLGDGQGNDLIKKTGAGGDVEITGGTLKVNGTPVMMAGNDYVRNLKTESSISSVTGTNMESIVKTIYIPANTLEEGYLTADVIFTKTGTANAVAWRVLKNTSNSLSGASQIALYNVTASTLTAFFHREFTVRGTGIYGYNLTGSLLSDDTSTSSLPMQGATLNRAVDNYILITAQLTDTADTASVYGYTLRFSKSN